MNDHLFCKYKFVYSLSNILFQGERKFAFFSINFFYYYFRSRTFVKKEKKEIKIKIKQKNKRNAQKTKLNFLKSQNVRVYFYTYKF